MKKYNAETIQKLQQDANALRLDVLNMIYQSDIKGGHFGGSLGIAEIVAVLYGHILNYDAADCRWCERDRLVLSKGHAVPVIYAALAANGFFDKSILHTYRGTDSKLQGHPDMNKTPGLDMSSGSLGQGLSVALGMALGAAAVKKDFKVFCLLSDGEMQEGMTWEAMMYAGNRKTKNLTAIVDNNNLQVDGTVEEIMSLGDLEAKFQAFNWDCITVDGNDVKQLLEAFGKAEKSEKPFAIICKTVKGKGISFMENEVEWHCCNISDEEYEKAKAELEKFL